MDNTYKDARPFRYCNYMIQSFPVKKILSKNSISIVIVLLFIVILGSFTAIMPEVGLFVYFLFVTFVCIFIKPSVGLYVVLLMAPLGNVAFYLDSPSRITAEKYSLILFPIILTALILFARKVSERELTPVRIFNLLSCILFFFLYWALTSSLWTSDVYHAVNRVVNLTSGVILYLIIVNGIRDKEMLEKVFRILIIWALILSIIFFISNKIEITHIVNIKLTRNWIFYIHNVRLLERPGGFAMPQMVCNIFGFFFFIGIALFPKAKKSMKYLLIIFGLFLLSNILATVSKGGAGAFLFGMLFLLFTYPGLQKKLLTSVLFLLLFLFVFIFNIFVLSSDRLVKSGEQTSLSFSYRIEYWKEGFNMLLNRFSGAGIGGFDSIIDPIPNAHSLYLSILFDLGFVGLVIYLLFISILLVRLIQAMSFVRDKDIRLYLYCMASSMVMVLTHNLVEMTYDMSYYWMVIGIVVATINIAEKSVQSPQTS